MNDTAWRIYVCGTQDAISKGKVDEAVNMLTGMIRTAGREMEVKTTEFNPLNPELNPICYLLALLGANHLLHVSRIRVKSLTLRLLMSYIYGAPILDVSRSHTTTRHSR